MLEGREIIYDPNMAGGVPSPAQGPGTDDKHGAQVASEPFFSKAFDTLGKKYVPGVLVPEMPFFGKELHEGRATSESNWLLEDYVTVYGTVQGWLRPSGGLWERGATGHRALADAGDERHAAYREERDLYSG